MKLNRKVIQGIMKSGQVNIGGRRTGSGGGGGGGVSATWVEENYISKAFFNTLFIIHGHDADDTAVPPTDVIIEPNDTETVPDSIEAMVGLWTEKYLSALGLSSGGGGGGDVLAEPLVSINGIGSPAAANQTLVWDGTRWTFKPYGQGGGSVTSIRITVPAGFNVSPSTAITSAGTFAITFASGYSLPTTAKQTNWDSAYTNSHTHSNKTVLDGITSTKVSNWDTAYGNFDANGNAKSALKLTTVSKTAWGRTYWTSGGVPDSISGDIENAANIKIDNNKKVSWKKSGASNYLSMLTLDADNHFIVGESMASEGLATYVRGRSINFQTGTGSSGNHGASMNDAGLFTVEKLRIGSIVISEDTQNGGLHVESAGLYADTYLSSLGAGSGGGGGASDYIPISGSSSITGSLTPATRNTYDLGSSTKAWNTLYVNRISGNASLSVQGVSCATFSTSASAVISSGAKFASICVESDSSGNVSSSRVGEINRYDVSLHLQYDSGTGNVTMCRQGFVFSTYTDGGGNNLSVISTNNRSLRIELGSASLNPYISKPWIEGSDIRLKKIVKTIGDFDILEIANAPIFDFTYKNDDAKIINLGTSAQYWQKVMPSAVKEMGDGYLSMNYGGTALAAAVLTARKVVNHEERIKALEAENERLRNEIEQLKVA